MTVPDKIRKSRQQEARGARLHGGRRNSGSGNTPWRKNDVRVDRDYLIEYKRTDKRSITLQLADLEDNRTNALLEGRTPVFGIEIGSRDWTLIETAEFERLRREAGAGGQLVDGQVQERPRVHVPSDGARAQEATRAGQGPLSRSRRSRRVSGEGSMP